MIRFCAASATPKTGSLACRSAHATGNSFQPPNGVPDCRLPPTNKRRRASSASLSDKCANEKHGCTLVRLNRIGSLILKATRRIGEQIISPLSIPASRLCRLTSCPRRKGGGGRGAGWGSPMIKSGSRRFYLLLKSAGQSALSDSIDKPPVRYSSVIVSPEADANQITKFLCVTKQR
jgi:hypothetical protein